MNKISALKQVECPPLSDDLNLDGDGVRVEFRFRILSASVVVDSFIEVSLL